MPLNSLFRISLDMEDSYKALVRDLAKFSSAYLVGVLVYLASMDTPPKGLESFVLEIYALGLLGLAFYHLVFCYLLDFDAGL